MSVSEPLKRLVRLKRLELLGYKTFAARTEFHFDGGITAVIGPNGSGKSNVADAVRWVLGEQSFSLLRAKKSEDMIFSGSERRARMGMAEVTLTLDNSDGWLDIDFAEVAITRRSYRSGENEYLLNGSRVRLRDISDLLGKSGLSRRTYTVIGQGLVDAALALRPQERRALIEEAAGLTLYQARRAEALGRLDETRRNVLRVHDLIGEIAPRVKRLQHQAERAQEYDLLRQELDGALRIWYSYQWKHGQDELGRVLAVSRYQHEQLSAQRQHLIELESQIANLRARQGELRRQLGAWHRESSALHARSEAQQRELAVAEERRRLLVQTRDEVLFEVPTLQIQLDALQEQVVATEAELADLAETLDGQLAEVQAAQAIVDARQRQVAQLLADRSSAQEALISLRAEIAENDGRLSQFDEQRQSLSQGVSEHQAASERLESQLAAHQQTLVALAGQLQANLDVASQVQEARQRLEQRIAAAQEALRGLQGSRDQADRLRDRLQERFDLLARLREEGADLYDGVRTVLRAARPERGRSAQLGGIVGTVGELVQVPQELETAIEVALGGQLQDVIVETWQDAQAAIEHLKHTQGGRATFLPLDTLRVARPLQAPRMAGVVGIASTLVTFEPRVQPVVDHLLGRTIVCQDLHVARRVLAAVKGSYQIVTPAGEVVRSSGAVTGGSRRERRQGGILAREREWRELPGRLQGLQKELDRLDGEIRVANAEEKALHAEDAVLAGRLQELAVARASLEQEEARVRQQIEQAERERDWHQVRVESSERELGELDRRESEVRQMLADLNGHVGQVERDIVAFQVQVEQMEDRDLEAQLADRRAQVALTRQRQAGKEAECEGYRRSLRQMEGQIADRQRRGQEVSTQLAGTERQIEALRQQESALALEIKVYTDRIEPAERALAEIESQQERLEKDEGDARTRMQDLESRYGRTQVDLARHEDRMASLRRQIKDDLGLVELDMGDELSGQPLLPLGPLVSSLPEVAVLPEGLEEEVSALKRRLRRLEPINPEAPAEYEELRQRHEFLSVQAHDLEQASTHLREVISELDAMMEREFKRVFHAVSREFRRYFDQLFGGGSAHLELTDPDDLVNTGIDIVARPPGKRQQGLALLSGGERALTTAALIFSILAVSPTPFCVLDEVDAALDEANVGRFRAVLQDLARETQFVVITHNRYTIEIADIVYGISMGTDGVSCVLSRQLNE